ncbi:MAG TPA: FAD-binding protein [Solirubrobacterales bacterium]|nr:FAD-binding protein [Solirubrobacterales bacterium]
MPDVSSNGVPAADLDALRQRLDGDVLVPGDAAWDAGRQAWNLVADQHPALVVLAESADDVAAAVRFAREHELQVAPQSTGHGAPPLAELDDALLLRTARMADVAIDSGAGTATTGAGAKWGDVCGPAAEHGLACLHGSSGTVGVAGYTLSGGLGWLARSRGFACNSVRSMEVVTADGEIRRVGPEAEPELFWALRGGGGTHAIVTSFEHGLVELSEAYAGSLMWPIEMASEVAHAWRDWAEGAPDELATTLKLLRFPPFPEIPEPLRGRALVATTFVYSGDSAAGEELAAPMRAVGEPYLDTVATVPAPALAAIAGDPEDPVPGLTAGILLESLDADAVDAYVELAGPEADVPLIFLELRRLGGALERSSPDHGALDTAGAGYLLNGVGAMMSPELGLAIRDVLAGVEARMAPWATGHSLLAFSDQREDLRSCFPPDVADRLERVKADYDPDRLILANHSDA